MSGETELLLNKKADTQDENNPVCLLFILLLTEIQGRKEPGQVVIGLRLFDGIPAEVMLVDGQIAALVEIGTKRFSGLRAEAGEEAADEGEGNAGHSGASVPEKSYTARSEASGRLGG